jgi:hypothetical protein
MEAGLSDHVWGLGELIGLLERTVAKATNMSEPEGWPTWLQVPVVILLTLGAALAWFTTGYGGLLVAGFGILVAIYLHFKNSN